MVASRTTAVLARFPRHFEASEPGKLFETVVDALAQGIDLMTTQLAGVRRAHRLAYAATDRDLLGLAGLHGLRAQDFTLLSLRLSAVRALAAELADPNTSTSELATALSRLPTLLGVPSDAFAPFPAEGSDHTPARARLASALRDLASYPSELDLWRARINGVIALHRAGNGTVSSVLGAASNALDGSVERIVHSNDRFWHAALSRDRMRLVRPEPPGSQPAATRLVPPLDAFVLEENPPVDRVAEPTSRVNGEIFHVLRAGFGPLTATARVIGSGNRTVSPMLVDIDAGFGMFYLGAVPNGQALRFEADGRVRLGSTDASPLAFTFRGAVFADAKTNVTEADPRDFVFAGEGAPATDRVGTFPVTQPIADAFSNLSAAPHAPAALSPITLAVGETRFAFFVRVAHFGTHDSSSDEPALPVTVAGLFDDSVFATDIEAGDIPPPAGRVGFEWLEPEAFAVRLWLPPRLAAFDVAGETPVLERVRVSLERHRAAGVHVYVDYQDDTFKPPPEILAQITGAALT